MRHSLKIMLAGLSALAFASCGKETPQTPIGGREVPLRIVPTIVEASTGNIGALTRAKVEDAFPLGAIMGLAISAPSATPALASFYDNFYGLNGGDAWRYYLNNVNAGSVLSGFSSWGDIELYGYYPYDATATDLTEIPFRIATLDGAEAVGTDATLTDYMVAGTKTKDMTTPDPAGELSLEFGHMMTAIELYINRIVINEDIYREQPTLRLGEVTFEIAGGREFVIAGTYNAIHPVADVQNNINATGRTTAAKMTFTYPSATDITFVKVTPLYPLPARLLMLMPELRHNADPGFEDATVTMTFSFVDQDGTPYLLEDVPGGKPTIAFKLSDITNTGTTDKGLLAGYSYAVTAKIGTYTHFAAPTTGTPAPPHVNYTPLVDADEDNHIDI